MNIEEYLIESERTERKFPEGKVVESAVAKSTLGLLYGVENLGLVLDLFKKVVAYDKPLKDIEGKIGPLLEHGQKRLDEVNDSDDKDFTLDQDQIEALHALLGLATEVAEIIPILLSYVFVDKKIDTVHLGEEIADCFWYLAILFRKFEIHQDDILQKNIDKLRVRYPAKFTSESALNRNLEAERDALEGKSNPDA